MPWANFCLQNVVEFHWQMINNISGERWGIMEWQVDIEEFSGSDWARA
jgi:hypothetical protein